MTNGRSMIWEKERNNMKGISEKAMKDIGIYLEQSKSGQFVMMVFNKDKIKKYGAINPKNCTPMDFHLDISGGYFKKTGKS